MNENKRQTKLTRNLSPSCRLFLFFTASDQCRREEEHSLYTVGSVFMDGLKHQELVMPPFHVNCLLDHLFLHNDALENDICRRAFQHDKVRTRLLIDGVIGDQGVQLDGNLELLGRPKEGLVRVAERDRVFL